VFRDWPSFVNSANATESEQLRLWNSSWGAVWDILSFEDRWKVIILAARSFEDRPIVLICAARSF